jgi:cytosine/uracil/thiamine/allantoin permease
LAADHFVARRGTVDMGDLYRSSGRYWFTGGYRLAALIPWVLGFFVFHWVNPSPLGWWMEAMAGMFGDPLSTKVSWLPGSIPAFAVAFLATLTLPRLLRLSSRSADPNRS